MSDASALPQVHVLILSTSMRPGSRACAMAERARDRLIECGLSVEWLQMSELNLPHCSGEKEQFELATVERLKREAAQATHILIASPIYNYDLNAAAKTAIEFAGGALTNKTVGFLCAAGGKSSYMSVLPFANSLMLDFRCWIVPRFVYATSDEFTDGQISQTILERIDRLLEEMLQRIPMPS